VEVVETMERVVSLREERRGGGRENALRQRGGRDWEEKDRETV